MSNSIDDQFTARFAAKPEDTERLCQIEEHQYRDKFQRDRDRVLYSKEFRRLSGKTQVFVTGFDDNMRNRLTHTLEVAQIATTIARRLGLNETLTEAIAYAHDIGHTPFGHIGERTLNYIMNGCFQYYGFNQDLLEEEKGFKHNLQGIRVASFLEDPDGEKEEGLNLTKYTLWGIVNHSSLEYKKGCEYCKGQRKCRYKNNNRECAGKLSVGFYNQYLDKLIEKEDWTFEAIVVAYADEIAQRHHDVEDGIYAGVIERQHLCEYIATDKRFAEVFIAEISKLKDRLATTGEQREHDDSLSQEQFIKEISRIIVNNYVTMYSDALRRKLKELHEKLGLNGDRTLWKEKIYEYVKNKGSNIVEFFGFDQTMKEADKDFGAYLSHHILYSELAQSMDGKASYIIRQLVKAYLTNPQQLPDRTIMSIINDWCKKNSIVEVQFKKHMTKESASRDKLKELINKDDSDIKGILLRRICDYISGMTDQYALKCFSRLYEANAVFYK